MNATRLSRSAQSTLSSSLVAPRTKRGLGLQWSTVCSSILLVSIVQTGCARDQEAPRCFITDANNNCLTPAPGLEIEFLCESLPIGALGAAYEHNFELLSEAKDLVWSAENLPPGLSIDASTGTIIGTPTEVGSYEGIVITATNESRGVSSDAVECPALDVRPEFGIDLSGFPRGCVPLAEPIDGLLSGGNETPYTCGLPEGSGDSSCPMGVGNGRMPAGLSFNPETCETRRTSDPGVERHGTVVWIVEIEQAERVLHVPYCYTYEDDALDHDIKVELAGNTVDLLTPARAKHTASEPAKYPQDEELKFTVTSDQCSGGDCNRYGFEFYGTCSAYDPIGDAETTDMELVDNSEIIGFEHTLSLGADGNRTPLERGVADRPWVVNVDFTYCTNDTQPACDDVDARKSLMTWSVISYPESE